MRIVIDARESGTSTGRYLDKLIEYLNKLNTNHEIMVLTKRHQVSYIKKIAPNFKVIESNYKEFTFAEQLGFLFQLRKLKPDLVHFGMTQQPVLYHGKAITTIHDLTTLRFDNPDKAKWIFKFKQKVYARVVKHVAKQSAYIITPSNYVKKDVAQYTKIAPSKVIVTYESADRILAPAQMIPRLKDKQFIMYVGRPTPHKNLERLIKAFELLITKHPQLMLVLAGKLDNNYRRIESGVTAKRMAHSIVFTDKVTEGELKWLYINSAAYVFPSLSEGFGLPGLEAMAEGAPVISSDATCLPEIYGQAAYYFDPKSVNDMATKINNVLISAGLRSQLVQRGRVQASKYSWRKMAEETLAVYEKALAA